MKTQYANRSALASRADSGSRDRTFIEFAFVRWKFFALLVGLGAAGFLTFTGGVLVGVSTTLSIVGLDLDAISEISVPLEEVSPGVDRSPTEPIVLEMPEENRIDAPRQPLRPAAVMSAYPAADVEWSIQVAIFIDPRQAETLYEELFSKGYVPRILTDRDSDDRYWHSVRIGRYKDRHAAEVAAAKIEETQNLSTEIRPWDAL